MRNKIIEKSLSWVDCISKFNSRGGWNKNVLGGKKLKI